MTKIELDIWVGAFTAACAKLNQGNSYVIGDQAIREAWAAVRLFREHGVGEVDPSTASHTMLEDVRRISKENT